MTETAYHRCCSGGVDAVCGVEHHVSEANHCRCVAHENGCHEETPCRVGLSPRPDTTIWASRTANWSEPRVSVVTTRGNGGTFA
jgi:hypothetical protein